MEGMLRASMYKWSLAQLQLLLHGFWISSCSRSCMDSGFVAVAVCCMDSGIVAVAVARIMALR